MTKRSPQSTLLLAAALSALPVAGAFAFSALGHKTVGSIGQILLERDYPETAKKVALILGKGVSLDMISTCADDVKLNGTRCGGAFDVRAWPESSGWHFINVPAGEHPTGSDLQKYCAGKNGKDDCVMNQIKRHLDVLANSATSVARHDRQLALMMVTHLVGDLYQPMHCTTGEMHDDDGKPVLDDRGRVRGDAGGNAKDFSLFKEKDDKWPMNLHHIIDNLVGTDAENRSMSHEALAKTLVAGIVGHRHIQKANLDRMALDSHNWGAKHIYLDYEENTATYTRAPSYGPDGRPDAGTAAARKAYVDKMHRMIVLRVQHAGEALSSLLDEALADVPEDALAGR